jgi:hypothetical protein
MDKTLVALYDDLKDARATLEALTLAGFRRSDITLAANASAEEYDFYFDRNGERLTPHEAGPADEHSGERAAIGTDIHGAQGAVSRALVLGGLPGQDAGEYAEGVRRGASLLMVRAPDDRAAEAERIMHERPPVDLHERLQFWRSEGFANFAPDERPFNAAQMASERQHFLNWKTGGTGAETGSPAGREAAAAAGPGTGRGVVRAYTRPEVMPADSEPEWQLTPEESREYRQHYSAAFGTLGRRYEEYEPAYAFGRQLAREYGNTRLAWDSLEAQAERNWELRHPGTWDEYRDAIRYSFVRSPE